jgi:hypothetical protein
MFAIGTFTVVKLDVGLIISISFLHAVLRRQLLVLLQEGQTGLDTNILQ